MSDGYRATFDSIEALFDVAATYWRNGEAYPYERSSVDDMKTYFTGVESLDELQSLAIDGWEDEVPAAMAIAESVVNTVTADVDMPHFSATWDVSGSEVDVARYLSGEPDCMIDYEMVQTPRAGRVITLVSSTSVSCIVSPESIKRRGHAVTALVMALSRMGFAIELWTDATTGSSGSHLDSTRVLIKGANDEFDAARIMFALAHPGMQRGLVLPSRHAWPARAQDRNRVGSGYGSPANPIQDMPEGTLYLPCVYSDHDVPDADKALIQYLTDLGIV